MFAIVLPWYIRMAIDTAIIAAPFVYFNYHPSTHIFEHFQQKRRIKRRRTLEDQTRLFGEKETQFMSKEEVQKMYEELGMKYQ